MKIYNSLDSILSNSSNEFKFDKMKLSILVAMMAFGFLCLAFGATLGSPVGPDGKCLDEAATKDIDACSLCCAENLFNRFDHKQFLKEKTCKCYMDKAGL